MVRRSNEQKQISWDCKSTENMCQLKKHKLFLICYIHAHEWNEQNYMRILSDDQNKSEIKEEEEEKKSISCKLPVVFSCLQHKTSIERCCGKNANQKHWLQLKLFCCWLCWCCFCFCFCYVWRSFSDYWRIKMNCGLTLTSAYYPCHPTSLNHWNFSIKCANHRNRSTLLKTFMNYK